MKTAAQINEELRKPFPPEDIEWRIGRSGIKKNGQAWASLMAYITARAVFDRLDEVVGPDCWQVKQRPEKNGFICSLSLKINGEWLVREDGAEETDIEGFKGGLSGAVKRAAVLWGIGNYLYNLGETWAKIVPEQTDASRWAKAKGRDGVEVEYFWEVDWAKFPKWALPTTKEQSKLLEEKSNATLSSLKVSIERNKEASPAVAPTTTEKSEAARRVVTKATPAERKTVVTGGSAESVRADVAAIAEKVNAKIEEKKDVFGLIQKELRQTNDLEALKLVWMKAVSAIDKMDQGDKDALVLLKDMRKAELSGF